jgi:hypothetical protein
MFIVSYKSVLYGSVSKKMQKTMKIKVKKLALWVKIFLYLYRIITQCKNN